MRRAFATAAAMLLLAAACGDDGGSTTAPPATEPTVAPTSTIAPITTTTTFAPPATTTTAAPTTTTAPVSTTTTMALPADIPDILTAGPGGIGLLAGPTLIPPVDPDIGLWIDAIPDGAGGLAYVGVGQDAPNIWWWPAGAAEPTQGSFKPGRILHDAAVIDGRPTAIVVDNPDPSPDAEPEDFVQLIDLATLETTTGRQVGGIEWGASQVSYRDGVFLVTEINHSCGALVAFDVAGADVDLPGLPEPPCLVHFEVPYGGADFGPAGTGYAYVEYHTEDSGEPGGMVTGADLVVIGEDGSETARIALGTGDARLGEVDYDGRFVLIAGPWELAAERPGTALLVDVAAATVGRLDAGEASSVHFAGEPPLAIG